MIFTDHAIEVPEIEPTPVTLATATQVSTPTPVPTIEKTEPATTSEANSETPADYPDDPGNSGTSTWLGIIAPVAIGLIVVIVIALIVRWIRN